MTGLFDTSRNFSFYSIPAAWVLSILPHAYAASLSKSFDKRTPRSYTQAIEKDQSLDSDTKARIARAEGAQSNCFENMGLFASAVVAGNLAGLPATTLNTLSRGHLLSQVINNIIYINNASEAMSQVRSVVFLAGNGQIMTLFVKSGNALIDIAANLI